MRRRKGTLKRYADLYRDPGSLFQGVETLIFPNGEPEIWFRTAAGHGFRLKVSWGPAGLAATLSRHTLTPGFTIAGNDHGSPWEPFARDPEACEVTITQYDRDDWAQAFRRWYGAPADRKPPHPGTRDEFYARPRCPDCRPGPGKLDPMNCARCQGLTRLAQAS